MRTLQILGFLLTASFVLSACGSEDYYCDDTGCFYCDGLGCRPVDAPTRPTCLGDYECAAGTVCTDAGCVAECSSNSDCPQGTTCRDGACLNPRETAPIPTPGSCTATADCAASGVICVDGMCVPDTACGEAGCDCSTTGACSTGFSCISGECRVDADICHFNAECGAGRLCVDGACTLGCDTAADRAPDVRGLDCSNRPSG